MIRAISRMLSAAVLALACAGVEAAQAAEWPARPVRFIVPFPPGGTVDPLARLVASRLSSALGQQFVVDNRTGGSGSIGTALAAKAAPDGYTYVFIFDTHAVNPFLIPNLSFDAVKDFTPVMLVGTAPMGVATSPGKPYKTFADVMKIARTKPGALTYGSVGAGSLGHLTMTLVQDAGAFKLIHVPYAGGGPMSVNILGGHIDMGIGSVALLAPHVASGKMRALVVTGDKRTHAMPDVPTLAEQGVAGIAAHAWWGILGPAGIPKGMLDRFHGELVKVLGQPDVRKQLIEQLAMDLAVSDSATLRKFIVSEMERWGKVVKQHGIKAD